MTANDPAPAMCCCRCYMANRWKPQDWLPSKPMLKQVESLNTTVSRQIHLQSCPYWTRSISQTRAAAMRLLYFFKYRAHSRRAPPKPVIDLLCLISIIITSLSLLQLIKKQQRRKRSFMKRQANAVRSINRSLGSKTRYYLGFNSDVPDPMSCKLIICQ